MIEGGPPACEGRGDTERAKNGGGDPPRAFKFPSPPACARRGFWFTFFFKGVCLYLSSLSVVLSREIISWGKGGVVDFFSRRARGRARERERGGCFFLLRPSLAVSLSLSLSLSPRRVFFFFLHSSSSCFCPGHAAAGKAREGQNRSLGDGSAAARAKWGGKGQKRRRKRQRAPSSFFLALARSLARRPLHALARFVACPVSFPARWGDRDRPARTRTVQRTKEGRGVKASREQRGGREGRRKKHRPAPPSSSPPSSRFSVSFSLAGRRRAEASFLCSLFFPSPESPRRTRWF